MRADLQALTDDDLVALTNRGTVKRAHKELAAATLKVEWTEADGQLRAVWSDGVVNALADGAALDLATCTCPAGRRCRHVVRTAIAYRNRREPGEASPAPAKPTAPGPNAPHAAWNPGDISDAALERTFAKAALTRARKTFEAGLAAELITGGKPIARLYPLANTVRFLVPGDPRYTVCDCAEPAPCRHVPLAVWAFRRLDADALSGLVDTARAAVVVDHSALDDAEDALVDAVRLGIAGASAGSTAALSHLAARLRAEDLIWPATVVDDWLEAQRRYHERDPMFHPDRVRALVGEWIVRLDALRSGTTALPNFYVRGTAAKRSARQTQRREYVGLGVGVDWTTAGPMLVVHLVDRDSGQIVCVERGFGDPTDEAAPSLSHLAARPIFGNHSLADLGRQATLAEGGRRSPTRRLHLGRTRLSLRPQPFDWSQLPASVFAESFREVAARLSTLPPPALRPRWVGVDVFVVPVDRVASASFSTAAQAVDAHLVDATGGQAQLRHPFRKRAAGGTDQLLAALANDVRYVCGPMQMREGRLTVYPLSVIVANGDRRHMVQPWVDPAPSSTRGPSNDAPPLVNRPTAPDSEASTSDLVEAWLQEVRAALTTELVAGVARTDPLRSDRWRRLAHRASALGAERWSKTLFRIADATGVIDHRTGSGSTDPGREGAAALIELAAHLELADGC